MAIKRHKPDEVVTKLRQVDVLTDLFILRGVPGYIRSIVAPSSSLKQ